MLADSSALTSYRIDLPSGGGFIRTGNMALCTANIDAFRFGARDPVLDPPAPRQSNFKDKHMSLDVSEGDCPGYVQMRRAGAMHEPQGTHKDPHNELAQKMNLRASCTMRGSPTP